MDPILVREVRLSSAYVRLQPVQTMIQSLIQMGGWSRAVGDPEISGTTAMSGETITAPVAKFSLYLAVARRIDNPSARDRLDTTLAIHVRYSFSDAVQGVLDYLPELTVWTCEVFQTTKNHMLTIVSDSAESTRLTADFVAFIDGSGELRPPPPGITLAELNRFKIEPDSTWKTLSGHSLPLVRRRLNQVLHDLSTLNADYSSAAEILVDILEEQLDKTSKTLDIELVAMTISQIKVIMTNWETQHSVDIVVDIPSIVDFEHNVSGYHLLSPRLPERPQDARDWGVLVVQHLMSLSP